MRQRQSKYTGEQIQRIALLYVQHYRCPAFTAAACEREGIKIAVSTVKRWEKENLYGWRDAVKRAEEMIAEEIEAKELAPAQTIVSLLKQRKDLERQLDASGEDKLDIHSELRRINELILNATSGEKKKKIPMRSRTSSLTLKRKLGARIGSNKLKKMFRSLKIITSLTTSSNGLLAFTNI